ncbi:MAG: Co2+/Mg2+ efflux protein ApaG [Pseudomonadota bacterium]
MAHTYQAITENIRVSVSPTYLADRSDPQKQLYFWAYTIVIENQGDKVAQLISRYWYIVDETGTVEEVTGEGVVGEQPVLNPGERFEYTSGCPLKAPSGVMSGHFVFTIDNVPNQQVEVPAFSLDTDQPSPSGWLN